MKRFSLLLCVCLLVIGCRASMKDCGVFTAPNMDTHYYRGSIEVDARTPLGIPVDTGGVKHDLNRIDAMAMEVKACLAKNFPERWISKEIRTKAFCHAQDFSAAFKAAFEFGCWQVKIDNGWVASCDGTQQLLSAKTPTLPSQTCGSKVGLYGTEECPCRYRVAQTGKTLIVPPDARLFKDGLVRIATGCQNPWAHPLLTECVRPSP
jgi:hypothetical protein